MNPVEQTIRSPRARLDALVRASEMQVRFRITDADGPQHARRYTAHGELAVRAGMTLTARGQGTSAKAAKSMVATRLLEQLQTLPS